MVMDFSESPATDELPAEPRPPFCVVKPAFVRRRHRISTAASRFGTWLQQKSFEDPAPKLSTSWEPMNTESPTRSVSTSPAALTHTSVGKIKPSEQHCTMRTINTSCSTPRPRTSSRTMFKRPRPCSSMSLFDQSDFGESSHLDATEVPHVATNHSHQPESRAHFGRFHPLPAISSELQAAENYLQCEINRLVDIVQRQNLEPTSASKSIKNPPPCVFCDHLFHHKPTTQCQALQDSTPHEINKHKTIQRFNSPKCKIRSCAEAAQMHESERPTSVNATFGKQSDKCHGILRNCTTGETIKSDNCAISDDSMHKNVMSMCKQTDVLHRYQPDINKVFCSNDNDLDEKSVYGEEYTIPKRLEESEHETDTSSDEHISEAESQSSGRLIRSKTYDVLPTNWSLGIRESRNCTNSKLGTFKMLATEEPRDTKSSTTILLAFKLPGGERMFGNFESNSTLRAIFMFIEQALGQNLSSYKLISNDVPMIIYSDTTKSIAQLGLKNRTLLHLVKNG